MLLVVLRVCLELLRFDREDLVPDFKFVVSQLIEDVKSCSVVLHIVLAEVLDEVNAGSAVGEVLLFVAVEAELVSESFR